MMSDSPRLTNCSVVAQGSDQVSCELDGEAILMHLESGDYFGCDEVGSRIWELIKTPRSVSSICAALRTEFDVEPETCELEVISFLENLSSELLVDVQPAASQIGEESVQNS